MKAIALAIILSLALPARTQEPSPGGIAAGAVIIVAGGITVVWLIKKCNKWFPRGGVGSTNVWEEFTPASMTYAASFSYDSGTCAPERLLPLTPTVTTVTIVGTNVTLKAERGEQYALGYWEFHETCFELGLNLMATESYSRNGQPCEPELVPIRLDRGVIRAGGGPVLRLERSTDLREWETVLRMENEGELRVMDASTEEACFYRVVADDH